MTRSINGESANLSVPSDPTGINEAQSPFSITERLRWGQVRFSVLDLVIIVCDWLKTENLA